MPVSKASKHAVDFTNVREGSGINPVRVEAGDYLAKITDVQDAEVKSGENKGQPQWLFLFQLEDRRSAIYPYYVQFGENQLWKLRNLLIAAGKNVPKKKVNVDPNSIVGKTVGITLGDDEYEGKEKSVIEAVFPSSELEQVEEATEEDVEEDDAADTEDEDELELDDL